MFTVSAVLLSSVGSLVASRNHSPRAAVLARARLRHAVWRGRISADRAGAGRQLRAARRAVVVAVAPVPRARRVSAHVCLLPDAAATHWAGPDEHRGTSMTPLLALVVSMLLENFQPGALTYAGAALRVRGQRVDAAARRWRNNLQGRPTALLVFQSGVDCHDARIPPSAA